MRALGIWASLEERHSLVNQILFAYSVVVLLFILAQTPPALAQLAPNQTHGFGNGRLVTFTYLQNFDCVDEPTMDLDFTHVSAQPDPNEMQTPILSTCYRAH